MKFAIVVSRKDEAGRTIARELENLGVNFIEVEQESIYADEEVNEKCAGAGFVIFATKHESEKKMPDMTVHVPGNWKNADYGGKEGKVCKTSAIFMKMLFNILNDETGKQGLKDYAVTIECTHHGPLIEKPCCFIEIGSSEEEWGDVDAGKVIAMTIKRAIRGWSDPPTPLTLSQTEAVIGIGGPHYCPNFSKIQLGSKYAIGHVIPQYALPLTAEIVKEAVAKTVEPVKKAIIDWKGCGISAERKKVIEVLVGCGLEVIRSDKIFQ